MDFYVVAVVSALIIVSPVYFAILFTSRLSLDVKIIVGAASFLVLTLLPLIYFLFRGRMGM